MINFFEQELRRLFGDGSVIHAPWFSGNDCRGTLDADLRVRVQFTCCRASGDYDALAVTVLNRTGGEVDRVMLRVENIWAPKDKPEWTVCGPRINRLRDKYEWQFYKPTVADYDALREAAAGYLDVYRSRTVERERTAPSTALSGTGRPRAPHKAQYER